jgi:exopolyphosphatase/guanosine-5'-triphosphate,3'-diphosphate pyrophosphatase
MPAMSTASFITKLMSSYRSRSEVRVAAVDVGSNSFHAIVMAARSDGRLERLGRVRKMVRLGQGTLREGSISPDAFQRGLDALRAVKAVVAAHEPRATVAVATSAVRDASNGSLFVARARRQAGLDLRVIGGDEEARLIYRGARLALPADDGRVALFDVGGGSTEVILGHGPSTRWRSSMKLGSLRLLEELGDADDPPTRSQLAEMTEHAQDLLAPAVARVLARGLDYVALTSGTALALARLAGEPLAPCAGVRRYRLRRRSLRTWTARLAVLCAAERVQLGVPARRADTILPGALILGAVLDATGRDEALVVGAALREGMVIDWLESTEFGVWGDSAATARHG